MFREKKGWHPLPAPANPVEKSLWFIENHFDKDISLDDVAVAANVSRHHLAHVFGLAIGRSVMGYVRARRLTIAAGRLAQGAPDILPLAIDAGYGSHQAFTRAFRDAFGLTPEEVRARATLTGLITQEPIRMTAVHAIDLPPPRFADLGPLLIAGLGGRYSFDTNAGIPAQWQRFNREFHGHVPNQKGSIHYGVSHNFDDDRFDYVCGAEVTGFAGLPAEFARVSIPAHRYAVFAHRDHISSISATHYAIMAGWAPDSGIEPGQTLNFERYDERFDPMTGLGGVEIWLPVAD